MKTLLAASFLAISFAAPALAQSADGTIGRSGAAAVDDASILPGAGSSSGNASTGLSGDGVSGSGGTIDSGTTQSTVPDATIPNASATGQGASGDNGGSGGALDRGTTQSTTGGEISNATRPNLNQPGTSLDSGVAPRSSGGIPNSLNGSGVPGSTAGSASGGSSAY